MRHIKHAVILALTGLLAAPPLFAQPETGMLCVIPDPPDCCSRVTVPFDLKTLMFRIDNGTKTPWPQKVGYKVEGLSLSEKHFVVIYARGKPIQSFKFRFTEFNATELCLLFDGYGGPDLRSMSKLCRCK